MKTVENNKESIKGKFDDFYKDGKSHWNFDTQSPLHILKQKSIEPFLIESKNILDLGCAEGNFLSSIVKNSVNAVGVDISETAISLAKEKNFYKELYVCYIDDSEKYTKNIKSYDFILLNEVLYYVDNYIEVLENILKLSSKYLFMSLAMGPQFFNEKDIDKIENLLKKYDYKLRKKELYNMSYKFGIPVRYLIKVYEVFRGIKLKQTHKYIYIYEKN